MKDGEVEMRDSLGMEVMVGGRMEDEKCRSSIAPDRETWTMMMVMM